MARIGVDLDGTLAEWHDWSDNIGRPIPAAVELVKTWIAAGHEVVIFTARGTGKDLRHKMIQDEKIREWCGRHLGAQLEITNVKDIRMDAIYDDIAVSVEKNTGAIRSPDSWRFNARSVENVGQGSS